MGYWFRSVGRLNHGVTFNNGCAKVCSPTIFETYVSYHKKVCPGCISDTGAGSSYLVGTLVRGCRCARSWCDLDLTSDFTVVTLTYKILTGLNFRNRKV